MNSFFTFMNSWLLGGLTYPALTFVIIAALKSALIVMLAWGAAVLMQRKAALMRLWLWRGCIVALLSVLLWAVAPGFVESWRMTVPLPLSPVLGQTIAQAQQLELVSQSVSSATPMVQDAAPLIAYTSVTESVPLASLRVSWMERIEGVVFHVWWSVALLLLAWRVFRAMCGHFWLQRQSAGKFNGTEHHLVRGLSSPVVTGWRKAHIWLPEEAAEWPEAKLRAVCLHEMAHYARNDGAWQWLGWLAASVWWWNPLAWFSLRQLTEEAELSADECALRERITPVDYAQMLVEIAAGGDLSTPAAGVAMLGRSGIEARVKALLSGAGRNSVFGSKTRLVLVLSAVAAMVAAGVEVRPARQDFQLGRKLSDAEKVLAKRALVVLEAQLEKFQRVHVHMTETWSMEGVTSPRPSVIEAWVDEPAKQSRTQYRPRVMRWVNGAAPWTIGDATEATDGVRRWSHEGSEADQARISKHAINEFFSFWEARPRARELVRGLNEALSDRFLYPADQTVKEEGNRIVIEWNWLGDKHIERWEVDMQQRGLASYRHTYPERAEPFSMQWSVEKWAQLDDGTTYPARMDWKYQMKSGPGSHVFEVQSLEPITGIPQALLALPEKKTSPYVATDGVARHGEWLEAHFVNAKTGKPVPEVKVHFEINGGKRTELISDSSGVLRIPLPKEEVKSLRYWAMKPGLVMQRVHWSRAGDPLRLPEVYETKLYPAGKAISGIVVDAAGKPVAGAEVNIWHTGGVTRWGEFADIHANIDRITKTDAEGKWLMQGFAEDLSGLKFHVEHPKFKRVAMSYENATGLPLESLRDGTSRIVLNSAGLEVGGVVADEKGNKVPNCSVTLTEDKNGRFDVPNAKTDASGRFAVAVHEAGKEWFTFEAAGFAPQMVELDVNADSVKRLVVVHLQPGKVFKARVVDEAGKPLPGVRMIADSWQEKRTLWFEGVTDAEGRLEWRGAPPDAVKWTLLGNACVVRDLPVNADGTEQTIVLRPALRVTGTVVDARTGQPVKLFQVMHGDTRRSAKDIYWEDARRQTFRDGEFTFEEEDMRFEHKLRITAEGYEPFETALFTSKQQTETLTVKLEPK